MFHLKSGRVKNAPAYFSMVHITTVKGFVVEALAVNSLNKRRSLHCGASRGLYFKAFTAVILENLLMIKINFGYLLL